MAHRCTRCGAVFQSGDMTILEGCPKCGWNKFLYFPEKSLPDTKEAPPTKASPVDLLIRDVDEFLSKEERAPETGKRIESIRILQPGSYELNLEMLLKRREIVIAVKENGEYILHVPSVFGVREKRRR